MDTTPEVAAQGAAALTEEQRCKYHDLVGRLMLAGRHPDCAIAMEAAIALRSLLVTGRLNVDEGALPSDGRAALEAWKADPRYFDWNTNEQHAELNFTAGWQARAAAAQARVTADDVSERALEIVGEVLDAKQLMLSHGCKQAPFADMFAEFVAMRATTAEASPVRRAEWSDKNVKGNPVLIQAMKNIAGCSEVAPGVNDDVVVPGDEGAATGRFFVYDPNAGHMSLYESDAERDSAHKEAISEYRRDAIADGEWSLDVERIVSGVVTHKTVETNVDGDGCDYEPR